MGNINTLLYHIDYQCENLTALKRADKRLTRYKKEALDNLTGRYLNKNQPVVKVIGNGFNGEGFIGT